MFKGILFKQTCTISFKLQNFKPLINKSKLKNFQGYVVNKPVNILSCELVYLD